MGPNRANVLINMKTPKCLLLLSLCLMVGTGFVASAFAQDDEETAHIDSLIEALEIQQGQVKERINPLETEAQSIKAEQEKLKLRLSQIETDKSALSNEEALTLDLRSIQALFNYKHGRCTIVPGEAPGEFFISNQSTRIRFLIAPEDSPKHPVAKIKDGRTIEFEQPAWSDQDPRAELFKASVRMDKLTKNVTYSIFHGENKKEGFDIVEFTMGMFGQRVSAAPEADISCVL